MKPALSRPLAVFARLAISLLLALGVVSLVAQPGLTQSASLPLETPDYDAWGLVADRAESSLADGRASTAAFEELRNTLVDWRSVFQAAQDINAQRIATAEAQVAALGAGPADGATESPDIAARRSVLEGQLAELRAPGIRAGEALNRASGLIAEIDTLIAGRDAERLLELGPSPVMPTNWPVAASELGHSLAAINEEITLASRSETQRQAISSNAPAIVVLVLFAALLLARVPVWLDRLKTRLFANASPVATRLGALFQDLLALGARIVAVLALVQALRMTSFLGFRGVLIVDAAQLMAITYLVARWLGPRLVPPGAEPARVQALKAPAGWVALAWGGTLLVEALSQFDGFSETTLSVVRFPLILLAAFGLFALARAARRAIATINRPNAQEPGFRENVQRILVLITRFVSFAAPLAAAIGYGFAGKSLIFAAAQTLALVAAVSVLTILIRDLYGVFRGKDDAGIQASLTPVVANLALVILSMPVLALIWGVRETRLSDIWNTLGAGVRIGGSQISPADFMTFAIVFVVGYLITRALQSTLRNTVLPKTRIEPGAQNSLTSGLGYIGIFAAAVIAISSAGIDLSSLAIVAGALSVGIGFGLQNIVSNFVSGIILLIERPISEGDWIEVGGQQGYVRDISVRSTRIETFDRSDVIVPNSDLVSGQVTNFTRGNSIGRVIVPVAVAYGTDTRKVEAILRDIAEAHPMVVLNPPPSIIFQNFGADGLDFEIRAILRDVNWVMSVKSDLNHEINKRFTEAGIEIPFAQRDLWVRNADQLAEAFAKTSKGTA